MTNVQRNLKNVDECRTGEARCQQRCVNVPGSYQCVCDRGYTLALDGHTCQDIDECALWHSHGSNLCIGQCINTPGSYTCSCPKGYRSSMDGRTCDDIDECAQGECRGDDRICVNTLGSYRCHIVRCPESYVRDQQYKNRCNRVSAVCAISDQMCFEKPISISNNFISVPSPKQLGAAAAEVHFELKLIEVIYQHGRSVKGAGRDSFILQKGSEPNSAVVALVEPLAGPQDVYLELMLRVDKRDQNNVNIGGKAVAKLVVHVSEQEEFFGQRRRRKRGTTNVQQTFQMKETFLVN
uniref:EGF-like domain-containing protein n=1 Tax=Romanomermis culicivorax TaxID=13658 RepID=A0A915I5A2_ROMCU